MSRNVAVRIDAPGKVNLRLLVLARETTGYHSLETIFCGISLADRITVEFGDPAIALEVKADRIDTGHPDQNLAVRAARLFHEHLGIEPRIRIRLEKRIPSAAGLGGGSSDAAATLRALSRLYGDPLPPERLLECAAALGSDVPFFLGATPFAIAWGRGERILSLKPPPRRTVVIARPGVGMPTAEAYQKLGELRKEGAAPRVAPPLALESRALASWPELIRLARNDFETVARNRIDGFDGALTVLRNSGAMMAMLAGSGSALFGVFPDPSAARAARLGLRQAGLRVWTARTLARWPTPTVVPAIPEESAQPQVDQ